MFTVFFVLIGIRLFLFRRSFTDKLDDADILSIILYLLPTGIIYFMILDLFAVILAILRWIALFTRLEKVDIRRFETLLAKKIGRMDRMNWEGVCCDIR